ncbi:MAG TPA: hypothetical protein VE075_07675, partial [Thermoanaerobaculia bacterium]|nr:hypothetical protein [Thermoanaerobaculia bacterium]
MAVIGLGRALKPCLKTERHSLLAASDKSRYLATIMVWFWRDSRELVLPVHGPFPGETRAALWRSQLSP